MGFALKGKVSFETLANLSWRGYEQIEAGIRGRSPGAATEAFLLQQQRLTRFWGCLGLAGLALASHLLDNLCAALLGAPLGAGSLLLLTGFLLSIERQVRAAIAKPKGVWLLGIGALRRAAGLRSLPQITVLMPSMEHLVHCTIAALSGSFCWRWCCCMCAHANDSAVHAGALAAAGAEVAGEAAARPQPIECCSAIWRRTCWSVKDVSVCQLTHKCSWER